MKFGKLRIFTIALFGAVVLHFVFTGIYSFSKSPRTNSITHISEQYSVPMFHQNWSLFAPDVPKYDVQLEFRIPKSGTWQEWNDASLGNGKAKHSRLEYIEQNINTGLAWQVVNNLYSANNSIQYDRIVASSNYVQALHFVTKLVERNERVQPDSLQLRLNFRFTPAQDKAYTFQTTNLEFPTYLFAE